MSADRQVTCRCGQRLIVKAHQEAIRCPKCGTSYRVGSKKIASTKTAPPGLATPNVAQHGSAPNYQQRNYQQHATSPAKKTNVVLIASLVGGGAIVVAGILAVVVVLMLGRRVEPQVANDSPASSTTVPNASDFGSPPSQLNGGSASPSTALDSTPVRIANFPTGTRLADSIDTLPKYLVQAAPFDVVALYDSMDADSNKTPEFLDALALISSDLRPLYDDGSWNALNRIGGLTLQRIDAMDIQDPSQWDANALRATDGFVDSLSEALSAGQRRFSVRPSVDVSLPHLQPLRLAVKILCLRAAVAIQADDEEAFLQEFRLLVRLAFDDARPSLVIMDLVQVANTQRIAQFADFAIRSGNLSEASLQELSKILLDAAQKAGIHFDDSFRMEELALLNLLYEFELNSSDRPRMMQSLLERRASGDGVNPVVPASIQTRLQRMNAADFDRFREEAIKHYEFAYQQASPADGNLGQAARIVKERFDSIWTEEFESEWFFLALEMPSFESSIAARARAIGQLQGAAGQCALTLWKMQNEQPPITVDELFDGIADGNVPMDPFSGKPWKLIVRDGIPILYSVGDDGHDDQALVEWDLFMGTQGDLIIRGD